MRSMMRQKAKRNEKRELSSVGSERLPYKQRVGGSTPSAPTTRKGKSKQNPEVRRLRDFLFMAGSAKGRDRILRLATPKKVAYFLYDYMEQKQRVIVYIGSLRSCLEQVGTQETVFPVSQNQRLPAH